MSKISRIVVQAYTYQLPDVGPSIWAYSPGAEMSVSKFIVSIETDDGHTGSYAPHYGATEHAMAQVCDMAPLLIG